MNPAAAGDAVSEVVDTDTDTEAAALGPADGVTTLAPISISYDPNLPPREVGDAAYDPAQDREVMRRLLGIGILATTGLIGLIGAVAILAGSTDSANLLSGVFTPLVGLSGAVLGFYFGGDRDRKA